MKKNYFRLVMLMLAFMGVHHANAAGVLTLTATNPVDGGLWQKNPWVTNLNVNFTLTFSKEVLLTTDTPTGVTLVKEDGTDVALPEGGSWKLAIDTNDPATVIVKMVESDGWQYAIMPTDSKYTLTVPAGLIMDEDMTEENEEISFSFFDSQKALDEATFMKLVGTLPQEEEAFAVTNGEAEAAVTLMFDSNVTIADATPDVRLLKESAAGEPVSVASWQARVGADGKSIVLEGMDAAGQVVKFAPEVSTYYFSIPASIVTDDKGRTNAAIEFRVWSSDAAKEDAKPHLLSATPADGDELPTNEEGKFEMQFTLVFDKAVSVKNRNQISFRQGSKDGDVVDTGSSWASWSASLSGDKQTLTLKFADWGVLQGFTPVAGEKYYLLLPAGTLAADDKGLDNEEIALEYTGFETTSISLAEGAGQQSGVSYDVRGMNAGQRQNGVVVIRKADGKVRKQIAR
ncbi:MAG: hypothetical protein J6M25_06825 [Prevotella sp.]|nr:hypothetical protein [Prevotella sp.]